MNESQLDFGPLRSKTAPEPATLPGAKKPLPKLDFVHSGCVGQRFYEAVNYGAREFSDVGLSRRYAENV